MLKDYEIDEIIKRIVTKVESEYTVSIGDVLAKYRDVDLVELDTEESQFRVTTTLMEQVFAKLDTLYPNQYQCKIIQKGDFVQYLVSKKKVSELEDIQRQLAELQLKDFPKVERRAKRAELWTIVSITLAAIAILISVIKH